MTEKYPFGEVEIFFDEKKIVVKDPNLDCDNIASLFSLMRDEWVLVADFKEFDKDDPVKQKLKELGG